MSGWGVLALAGLAEIVWSQSIKPTDGFTRLVLVVDPSIELESEEAVRRLVLESLARGSGMEDFARSLWQMAGSLKVERRATEWTARGKYPSLVVGQV